MRRHKKCHRVNDALLGMVLSLQNLEADEQDDRFGDGNKLGTQSGSTRVDQCRHQNTADKFAKKRQTDNHVKLRRDAVDAKDHVTLRTDADDVKERRRTRSQLTSMYQYVDWLAHHQLV